MTVKYLGSLGFSKNINSSLSSIQQILLCFPQIFKIFYSVSDLSAVPLGALALSLEMAVIGALHGVDFVVLALLLLCRFSRVRLCVTP